MITNLIHGIAGIVAPGEADNIKEAIKAFEGTLGVDINKDLFGAFGDVMSITPGPSQLTTEGPGFIDQGRYVAPQVGTGPVMVLVSNGTVTSTATVMVVDRPSDTIVDYPAGSDPSLGLVLNGSAVRQGRSRSSRIATRSTTSLAIRRQVVSLPPVIVSIPDDVSYSSALREMSTDFLGSPVEISGRTPA